MLDELSQLSRVHESEKTYWVVVEGDPTPEKLAQLEHGIYLKDYRTLPARARLIPDPGLLPRSKPVTPHGPTAWIEIKLREGKKRQIRHTLAPGASAGVTAAVGLPTLRLVRAAIGRVQLGNLELGQWRDLTQDEIDSLRIKLH